MAGLVVCGRSAAPLRGAGTAPVPSAARRCEDPHLSQQRRCGAQLGRECNLVSRGALDVGQRRSMAWPAATDLCGRALVPQLAGLRPGSAVCHWRDRRSMCRETEDGCPGRARLRGRPIRRFNHRSAGQAPNAGPVQPCPPASLPSWGGGHGLRPAGSRPVLVRAAWPSRTCDGGSEVDDKAGRASPFRSVSQGGPQVCGPDPLSLIACCPALTRGQAVLCSGPPR